MGKLDKYFISDTPANPIHPPTKQKGGTFYWNSLFINDEERGKVPGAYYLETNLVLRPSNPGKGRPHNHAWDEYLMFLGTNPDDVSDLGGEVEFYLEDERHIITKSTAVFVPEGMYHLPITFLKVDRPITWITTGNTLRYRHLSYNQDPKYTGGFEVDDDKVGLPPIVKKAQWISVK